MGRTDGRLITIKTKSEVKVKVKVTRKWYATLRHSKMHPHTKSGIPNSKNIGDMHPTQAGRTDVRPILNIGPVYKGPLIRGQVPKITDQFSSELAH